MTNYNYKDLAKQRTSIPGSAEEVERFYTWWSNNIATAVVYNNGYYRVFCWFMTQFIVVPI
jgi:hypothetical protein